MTVTTEAQRLMDLMDGQLFRPVLDTNPDSFPPHQRDDVRALQTRLEGIQRQIRSAGSPEAMVRDFGRIAREDGQSLDDKLTALGFPAVSDIRYEVEKLGAELGLQWQDDEPGPGPRGTRQEA